MVFLFAQNLDVEEDPSIVTSLCAVCDLENENRRGSFFCSEPFSIRGDLIASRARQADSLPIDRPKNVGEWRASYRRFSHNGELATFHIVDDQTGAGT